MKLTLLQMRQYATKNTVSNNSPKESLITQIASKIANIKQSQLVSSLKSIVRAYALFKSSIKGLIWSILGLFGIHRLVNPFTSKLYLIL